MSPLDQQKELRSVELSSILKCYERDRMHTLMLLMRHCSSVCSAVKRDDNKWARPTPDSGMRRSVKPWSWKCGKVNFNIANGGLPLPTPPPPSDMPRWAHYCFISLRHQLSPALDCVSHKKAESRAASHCGILWNQLARTPGHTSSSYTSYFCPTKAAAGSFRGNLLIIWSPLPLS